MKSQIFSDVLHSRTVAKLDGGESIDVELAAYLRSLFVVEPEFAMANPRAIGGTASLPFVVDSEYWA